MKYKLKYIILTHQEKILKNNYTSIFCHSQIGTCYHMRSLRLILGKNLWTDNAGLHGYEKRHHLRMRGKMKSLVEIISLGVCMIPCLLRKGYQDDNICLVNLKFGKTIASLICFVKNMKFGKKF